MGGTLPTSVGCWLQPQTREVAGYVLSVWFYHALTLEGSSAICIDARHAKAALDMARNKTDANDADGLAHLAEARFYCEVRVKSFDSMLTRTLVAARNQLLKMTIQLSNQIPGLMKTSGLIVPNGAGRVFNGHVRSLLASNGGLEQIILPVLEAWRAMRARAAELSRQLVASARASEHCQLLSSIPGIGAVTASSFVAAIEDPGNFRKSRSVGARHAIDEAAVIPRRGEGDSREGFPSG